MSPERERQPVKDKDRMPRSLAAKASKGPGLGDLVGANLRLEVWPQASKGR